jgi:hypothetical protein
MVTEKAIYIHGVDGLNRAWPTGADSLSEADNHIRMLKSVIQNTFPNADTPLLVSSTQINNLPTSINYSGEYVTLLGPYDYNTEEDKILKINSNNEIVLDVEGSYPIGMVFWSILTLAKIQQMYGTGYVLANGQTISNTTEYYRITNKTTVPNIMANTYIRPTYLVKSTSGPETKTLEPSEVVQTESTAAEVGFSAILDDVAHAHGMSHVHRYNASNSYNHSAHESSANVHAANWEPASGIVSGPSSMNLSSDTHDHTINLLNNTPTKNELNRLTLNPFIRIN